MLIRIPHVLNVNEITKVLAGVTSGEFVDGRLSAGEMARKVKKNLELKHSGNQLTEMDRIVVDGLTRNQAFREFALPTQVARPIFSRYECGMEYGLHVDAPVIGTQPTLRTDLAVTLFLSDPASYDGGELIIETTFGEQTIKLPAGDAVVYSATALHRVAPITRGTRYVALSWVQSAVRDESARQILYDLALATRQFGENGPSDPADLRSIGNLICKVYANLMRREADI